MRNFVLLLGRMVGDMELRSNGKKGEDKVCYAYGRIAIDIGKEEATFIDFKAVGKTAETMSEFATKGKLVQLIGYVSTYKPEGEKFDKIQIVVNQCLLLSSKKDSNNEK